MLNKSNEFPLFSLGLVLTTLGVSACGGDDGTVPGEFRTDLCNEVQNSITSVLAKDGMPALSDPELVDAGDPVASYLRGTDRVIGLEVEGEYIAFPHNILWWHEIVNMNDVGLAVTYCPLTGSSMVFRRDAANGAEFGVSGLIFQNNLVMYDRSPSGEVETLWPQMLAGARCGPREGRKLTMAPALEIEWEEWVALHPETKVVSGATGYSRDYTLYPYGNYK